MKKVIILVLILSIVIGVGLYFYNNSAIKKADAEERAAFNGMTKGEISEQLQAAWKEKWIEANVNWIMVDEQPADWLNAIKLEAEKHGDTRPLEDIAYEQSIFAWSGEPKKANDSQWGKDFVWTYVYTVLGQEPNSAEIQAILVTI